MSQKSVELEKDVSLLWKQFKRDGNQRAGQALYEHYLHLVTITRCRTIPTIPIHILIDDLMQVGSIALFRAIHRFESTRGAKFESYAIKCIRGAMHEYLRQEDWVPRSVRVKQKRLNQALLLLEIRNGSHSVCDEDLARELSLPIKNLHWFLAEAEPHFIISLDHVRCDEMEDDDLITESDAVRSQAPEPETLAIGEIGRTLVRQCVSWLPRPERRVIELHFFEELTHREIAKEIHRTESRVMQLCRKGLGRLNNYLARQRGLVAESDDTVAWVAALTEPEV